MHTHTLHLRVGRMETLMIWISLVIGFTALLILLIDTQYRIDVDFNQFQEDEEEDF